MYQLAYSSACTSKMTSDMLNDIFCTSQENNQRDGISGVLMYHDRIFFQVIEGPEGAVTSLYRRLQADPRHTSLALIWDGNIDKRSFGDWAMGYAGPDEISEYTTSAMVSLESLRRNTPETANENDIALALARGAFADFVGKNQFNNALGRG